MGTLVVTECINETTPRIYMLDIGRIIPNNNQPRRYIEDLGIVTLADSIQRHGILQPLSVQRCDGGFMILAGERRYRAACMLNMKSLPCIIMNSDRKTSAIIGIIENMQRSKLNMFEEATAILSLKEIYGMTQEETASALSVSQSYIANKLRLLKFSDEEQCMILMHSLTERHCRALLRLDESRRKEALIHVIEANMNVSAAEVYVDKLNCDTVRTDRRLKDYRLFYNSIDRAVNAVRRLGVDVITESIEDDKEKRLVIRLPN